MKEKICLYANTIKYLKGSQLLYRVLHKVMPVGRVHACKTMQVFPHIFIKELDASQAYLDRFDCNALLNNEVLLLHETFRVDFDTWTVQGKPTHLWMFNLHYMEYLIPMAVCYEKSHKEAYYAKIKEIMEAWMKRFESQSGDAWNPYTISERIPNWLIVMELLKDKLAKDTTFGKRLENSLYCQYAHLQGNQEKHLLGNHYFENLKALILGSIMFGESQKTAKYLKQFDGQMKEQILSDGMHYERSFMYHKIIMEDVLRVLVLLQQIKRYEQQEAYLQQVLSRMLSCTISFEDKLQRVPLFNDAGNNVTKPVEALENTVRKCLTEKNKIDKELQALPQAGYYKYQRLDVTCIIDCGEIGPDYIPGHGHCDCLSYEMYVDGVPFIVNSGTYQYQSSKRAYFRSTKAHNCFTINEVEQSQCWGEHRVAKRITEVRANQGKDEFLGECRFWNGMKAIRKIEFAQDGIVVYDSHDSNQEVKIQSYVHLAPQVDVNKLSDKRYQLIDRKSGREVHMEMIQGERMILHLEGDICSYAEEFGKLESKKVFEMTGSSVIYRLSWRMK